MTKLDVAQLLSDQMSEFLSLNSRKPPMIEPEFDDEGTDRFLGLDRWQDRQYTKARSFGPIWRD